MHANKNKEKHANQTNQSTHSHTKREHVMIFLTGACASHMFTLSFDIVVP